MSAQGKETIMTDWGLLKVSTRDQPSSHHLNGQMTPARALGANTVSLNPQAVFLNSRGPLSPSCQPSHTHTRQLVQIPAPVDGLGSWERPTGHACPPHQQDGELVNHTELKAGRLHPPSQAPPHLNPHHLTSLQYYTPTHASLRQEGVPHQPSPAGRPPSP